MPKKPSVQRNSAAGARDPLRSWAARESGVSSRHARAREVILRIGYGAVLPRGVLESSDAELLRVGWELLVNLSGSASEREAILPTPGRVELLEAMAVLERAQVSA
jgi:hypothetical protein